MLACAYAGFFHHGLLLFRAGDFSQLSQVIDNGANLGFTQVRERWHVRSPLMQSLQQRGLRLIGELCCVGPAHVHSTIFHPLHHELRRRRSRWIDYRVNLWWNAEAKLAVTPPAIQPIEIGAVQDHHLTCGLSRPLLWRVGAFLLASGEKWSQVVTLAHAGFLERPMEVVEPALAFGRGNRKRLRASRLTQCG